jgi:hypothetical protein
MHTEIYLIVSAKDRDDAVIQAAGFLETEHFFDYYDIWAEGIGTLQEKRAVLLDFQKDYDWKKLADEYYKTAEELKASGSLSMAGFNYIKAGCLYSQRFNSDTAVFNTYDYDYSIPGEDEKPETGDWYAVPVNFHY